MSSNKNFQSVQFLIVDDDEISVMAIQRAMKKLKIVNPVQVAKDGIEALEFLRGTADKDKVIPPYIITLDLNMPRMGGLEFLEELRRDPMLQRAIVFVLTTSDSPQEVSSAYDKNIAGYIVKESASESFAEALKMIDEYANLVVLPN